MATIKDASRLIKRVVLSNLDAKPGLALTPLLEGTHGIGKSMVVKQAAKELGGLCCVVEGGSLKEGEITGLPVATETADNGTEVRFVKYYVINAIRRLEEFYYNKAKTEGLLNGDIKIDEDDNLIIKENGKERIYRNDNIMNIFSGSDNKFKLGENTFSAEMKLRLFESGEIKPLILFIDEINRTEMQVMKELMNIILNKSVNGYDLPWWVTVVSAINPASQDSSYATNEMDPAQKDRLLRIKVRPDIEDWAEYEIANGVDPSVIGAIAATDGIFISKEAKQISNSNNPEDEMTPSPRSWEMVAHIYATTRKNARTKYFTAQEQSEDCIQSDLETLIAGKVGVDAKRTFIMNMRDTSLNTPAADIINGKSKNINPVVAEKLKKQPTIRRKLTSIDVINYLTKNIVKFENASRKNNATQEDKKTYVNVLSQIKEYVDSLDKATRLSFVKTVAKTDEYIAEDNIPTFMHIAKKCFATEVLAEINEYKADAKKLNED